MSGEACNIGPKGVTSRWLGGFVMLAVAIAGAVYLVPSDLDKTWRLALFLPLLVAGLSFFQAKARTWVVLAARGTRKTNGAEETVEDAGLAATLAKQGKAVWLKTIAFAVVLTAVVYFL